MPLLMLICLEYSVPSEWFKIRVVFHWSILDVRNWTMIGDNVYIQGILISSHGEQNQMPFCNLSRLLTSFSFSFLRPQ